MNISQRALLRVARTCTKEARRAELLGQRRYAREIRGGARRALAEAAAEGSAPRLHSHTKSADDCLQAYRDSVVNNPEQEKRRSTARAYARVLSVGLH